MNAGVLQRLGRSAVHIVVDMQRLFAEQTEWHTPGLMDIVPAIARLCGHTPERTVFTRFMTPGKAADAPGAWQGYYRRWQSVTLEHLPAGMLDLVAPFESLARPGAVFDKTTHSAFASGALRGWLADQDAGTLVISGVETDVCVLATALDAVDLGYHVVIPGDAVASSVPESHRNTLDILLPRFDQQIAVAAVDRILAAWNER